MNASPKSRFLEQEKLAGQFLDVVDSEAFQRASELAMISLMEELKPTDTLDYVRGAQRFLEILKNLPEKPKPLPARISHNLDHVLK